jgi:hypothetical protein
MACGQEVVRGADDPSIDAHAVSTGLDKEDMKRSLRDTLNKLRASPIMNEWRTTNPAPIVAIFPFQNSTSEHIEPSLETILSEAETWLLEANAVRVVSVSARGDDSRGRRSAERRVQPGPRCEIRKAARREVLHHRQGFRPDERSESMRRVQYFLYLQVIDVETSEIRFQAKSEITKAVK